VDVLGLVQMVDALSSTRPARARLAALLDTPDGSDLALTTADEAAYTRTVDRFNAMWALSNGPDRYL
jgi:hypothetical protein